MFVLIARPVGRLIGLLALAGVLVLIGLACALPRPAQAASRPGCVNVSHSAGIVTQSVTITNNCDYTVSYRVRKVGLATPCWHVDAHRTETVKWANGYNYQGTTFGCD